MAKYFFNFQFEDTDEFVEQVETFTKLMTGMKPVKNYQPQVFEKTSLG